MPCRRFRTKCFGVRCVFASLLNVVNSSLMEMSY